METISPEFAESKGRLRKLYFIYGLSVIILLVTLSGAILIKKYTDSLYATLDRLQEFNVQYIKVLGANHDIDRSLTSLKAMMPKGSYSQSGEEHMFMALDDLKLKAGSAEIVVTNIIEDKGAELQLSVVIRGPLKDYTSMVNFIGYLQSLKFPFYAISGAKIQRSEESTSSSLLYEIKGMLKYPKIGTPARETGTKGVPGKS
jgi:hypothetical protein